MIKHIAFTMYPVKNMVRARRFYEEDLGLEVGHNAAGGAWIEYYLDNGCFAITTLAEGTRPDADSGGCIAFEVDELDGLLARLRARKIAVKIEPFETPVCRMAFVVDPEGNALCLHAKKE